MITSWQVVAELRAQRHRVDDALVIAVHLDHDHFKESTRAVRANHQSLGIVQLSQA
jgi:hypothetical protein